MSASGGIAILILYNIMQGVGVGVSTNVRGDSARILSRLKG